MKKLPQSILRTGLLAGLLDGAAAIIQFFIKGGKDPAAISKFIASGVYGKKAFAGGISIIIQGIILHFLIAFLFTCFFFWIYPKLRWISSHKILAGIFYGLFTWGIMNLLVVPLSNAPHTPFKISQAVISALILILCVGIPISLMTNKYYLYKK